MSNRIAKLLTAWWNERDAHHWVLATIIATQGSSYRKAGAMMLINDMGQYHGMLSGGCLESDIMLQARRCWDSGNNHIVTYDMTEEQDLAWKLGIGCGGAVTILLQPVSADNHYLDLPRLRSALDNGQRQRYQHNTDLGKPRNSVISSTETETIRTPTFFAHCLHPVPRLGIFGGGLDAIPLVKLASVLGWDAVVFDSRANYAKAQYFTAATCVHRHSFSDPKTLLQAADLHAAIVMTHNIELDAQALQLLTKVNIDYLGLLGPPHRTDKVLAEAGLAVSDLPVELASPCGLRLGGDLPESIALSMLAEAHAVIEGGNAQSISSLF